MMATESRPFSIITMKSTEVQTPGALWRARVSKRRRRATNWWAGFSFSCYSWSLASSRWVWRRLTTVLDSMREAIYTRPALHLLVPPRYAEHQTAVSLPVRCVFAYCLFRALALQRIIFRENPTHFLTFVARWEDGIVSGTNRHSRGYMRRGNPRCACAPRVIRLIPEIYRCNLSVR